MYCVNIYAVKIARSKKKIVLHFFPHYSFEYGRLNSKTKGALLRKYVQTIR